MLLNIVKAKSNEGLREKFDVSFSLNNELVVDRGYKFLSPIHVCGTFYCLNDELFLEGKADIKMLCICDNCGEEFEKGLSFDINEKFVDDENKNEEDYQINHASISLDEPVIDNLLFSIPTKMLCKEDCKGLCHICGKNRNEYSCNCEEIAKELGQQENPFSKLKK